MSYAIQPYDDALTKILKKGKIKSNKRTGVKTLFVPGIFSEYDLTDSFPLVTKRKLWPKSIWAELLWFISGSTNNGDLNALGAKIWDSWVDENFENKHGYAKGSFGPVYGFQLRHFGGYYGNGVGGHPFTQDKSVVSSMNCTMEYNPNAQLIEENLYGKDGFDQLDFMVNRIKEDPSCRRILFSLWNPKEVSKMKLPPCFLAGHSVETGFGYKNIENLNIGDKVKTHDGTFQFVKEKFKTPYNGDILKITLHYMTGLPIECTPNHPFLVKDKGFIESKNLKEGDFLAIPRLKSKDRIKNFSKIVHTNQYGNKKDYLLDNPNDWYTLGYFLGDGWCDHNENGNRVCFSINDQQVNRILPLLRRSVKISKKPKSITYDTRSNKWNTILREFGHLAHNKQIPLWVLEAPDHLVDQFIQGYTDADGCVKENYTHYTTVSKNIALGLQQLFFRKGMRVSIYRQKRPVTKTIEGRIVKQRDTYNIVVKNNSNKKNLNKYIIEDDYIWVKVKNIVKNTNVDTDVYNISVDKNHTYTVENIVNHNCHYTYQVMIDDDGEMTGELTQRSADFPIGVPANIQFYSALTMMLAQQTGFKAVKFNHHTVDSHIYYDQISAIEEYLSLPSYDCPTLTINKATDIYSYKLEDFVLSKYECGPKLEIPVAV